MKYKYFTLGSLLCLLVTMHSKAQLFIQGNSVLIQSGATVHVDGLSLTPALAINLISNEINHLESSMIGTPHSSINRIYKVESKMPFTGKIGMRYQPSELNGNDESLLQFSFGEENLVFTVPTNKSMVDLNNHYIEEDVVSQNLWAITATTSGSILPVKLVDFTAIANENKALLAWSTSEETNSDVFEIQHSIDGKQWIEVGRVKANGESNVVKTYAFEHGSPVQGDNLYRLKMVDLDGTFAYSRVRSIHFEGGTRLTFHPNPVLDWLTIDAADWASLKNLKITNVAGVKVGEWNEAQLRNFTDKRIDLQRFPSGMYILSLTDKNGTVQSEKIFKH
ncbi:T9SS type A sorting domain-containing protein [Dyadobacter sp. CY326]|uniref:T9SS type A sorting domain-containing protein n=1 Tax=Dyadobacter sp. CY326 TaxID=2907300 RepID=UPI001F2DEB1A|nr:T9SS type A sorting domain-containing protein [Dyadobacter sp. CY326]MCE7065886.1 T9SS type A sorting domain-containing protein [Dyadobacter sp. CY326]